VVAGRIHVAAVERILVEADHSPAGVGDTLVQVDMGVVFPTTEKINAFSTFLTTGHFRKRK
jgi:hypothetical protein